MKFADTYTPKFRDSPDPILSDFKEGTVAHCIQKYIEEMDQPGERPIGASKRYTLRQLQRDKIGEKMADSLKAQDYIEYGRLRRAAKIQPPTIDQGVTYLRVVLQHASDFWGIELNDKELRKARREMMRRNIIGKSKPRDRLPTYDELERRKAFFIEQDKHHNTKIPMALIEEWQTVSGRRIGETTRLRRCDVNVEDRTCKVYDLKNSKGKGVHGEFALLGRAWEIVKERLEVIPQHPEARLFPWNSKTISGRSTQANKALGIKGLRLHDDRAQCFTSLLKQGYSVVQVQKGVSLHKDADILVSVYSRIKAADLHAGPAGNKELRDA